MTTQHSASHSLQGTVFALLRVMMMLVLLASASSAWSQCIAPAPYLQSDPCYVQAITGDPFCCNTSWDSLCQGAYDACASAGGGGGGGGGTGCSITISMQDSFGDGWNGAFLSVFYNGVLQNTYTAVGFGSTFTFTVPQGVAVSFSYTPGSWESEVSYTISVNGTVAYGAGPFPPTGLVYSYTCPADPGGGGDPGGGTGGSCAPGVGGAPFAGSGSINIQPIGSASSAACNLVINFYDSLGDGWDGAYISVVIDGVLFGDYTINTGGFGSLNVPLNQGETVTLTYVPGFFEDEVSFEVIFGGVLVYSDGPFPTTGLIYSTTCSSANGGSSLPVVNTPQELITEVFLGECLTASNVTYTGSTASIGTFTNGWGIGIESGIILTTGNVLDAVGPNLLGSTTFTSGGGASPLLGFNTNDQATFTFTFIPETEQVTFTYVFASEEYPEYVCSTFNDAFGFFVSGPGYTANTNIAIVPGSTLPVAINTVNSGVTGAFGAIGGCSSLLYSSLYVNNVGGVHNEYDGFTLPLTACINTVPCEPYTITITVADVGDAAFDSAVFLAAESFSAGTELEIVASVDQDLANVSSGTNCDMNGFFVFALEEPSTDPVTLVYNVTVQGEATVNPVPLSVTFQPGETLVAVPVTSVTAGTSLTTVTVTMSSVDNPGLGCSCTETEVSSTLFLCDQLLLLPVTWLAFEAKNINDQREVLCEWITASEQNNDFFTVERSVDGQVWIELGTVAGSGNTSEPTNYQFIDRSPAPGVSYYRIRQTDYDGQFDYSETRAVERRSSTPLEAFPNPGNGVFKLSGYHDGDLGVYDLSGRRVPFTLSMSGELRLVNPAAGSYIVELLRDNGEAERLRIVVQ